MQSANTTFSSGSKMAAETYTLILDGREICHNKSGEINVLERIKFGWHKHRELDVGISSSSA
jgi:hypothetical protein